MAPGAKIGSAVVVLNTFVHIEDEELLEDKRRKRRASSDPPIYGRRAAEEAEAADCDVPSCEAASKQAGEHFAHDDSAGGCTAYLQLCTPCTSRGASPERGRLAMGLPACKMQAPPLPSTHQRPAGLTLSLSDALSEDPLLPDLVLSPAAPQAATELGAHARPAPLAPPPGSFSAAFPATCASVLPAAGFAPFDGACSPASSFALSTCSTAATFWDVVTPLSAATAVSPMAAWTDPRSMASPFFPSPLVPPALTLNPLAPWEACQSMQRGVYHAHFHGVASHHARGQDDARSRRSESTGKDGSQLHGAPTSPQSGGDDSAKPSPLRHPQLLLGQAGCESEQTSSCGDGGETKGTPRQLWNDMTIETRGRHLSENDGESKCETGPSELASLGWELDHASCDETESTADSDSTPIAARTSSTPMSRLIAKCNSMDVVLQVLATECIQRDLPVKDIADALQASAQRVTSGPPAGLAKLPAFEELFGSLKRKVQQCGLGQESENLKVLKALGKLEVQGPHAHWFIAHFEGVLDSSRLSSWASQDLVFCLWALSKMVPDGAPRGAGTDASRRVAHAVVVACVSRVHEFKPQCLAMSIHAIAKLRLSGGMVDEFAVKCMQECAGSRDLQSFGPQSLANILWAAMQLCPDSRGKGSGGLKDKQVWLLWHAVQRAARPRLCAFPAQELSMVANATSKLQQRALKGRSDEKLRRFSGEADAFLLEVGRAAAARVGELSAQGISNIALSLAKGDVLSSDVTRNFLRLAAERASHRLHEWEPQAISNFCCAIGRVCSDGRRVNSGVEEEASFAGVFGSFGDAVAHETARRLQSLGLALEGGKQIPKQFGWVDVSGVLTAFGHGRFCSKQVFKLVLHVLGEAQRSVHQLSMRVLLNVGLSASRLSAPPEFVAPLADAMADRLRHHREYLTVQDKRQWDELRRFCKAPESAMPRTR